MLRYDVAVVGGGLAGQITAAALGSAGIRCAVIDRLPPDHLASLAHDGRTTAFALGSQRVLDGVGVWPLIDQAQPITDIRVSDSTLARGTSSLCVHYDCAMVRTDDGEPLEAMGWIVENADVRRALFARLGALSSVEVFAPAGVAHVERGVSQAVLELEDGRKIACSLIVAADGKGSQLRQSAGIKTVAWSYPQTAIVCLIAHERPHGGVALENFLPSGPFAVLPMCDGTDGTHRSSIVWTERESIAPRMLDLDEARFSFELQRRVGRWLGDVRLHGKRWSHPVGLLHAHRYWDRRLILVGDAAHAIHPIAGQGLNMGVRDIAALAELLADAHRLGLDLGDPALARRYERWRRFDNITLSAVTDGLNRLFSTDLGPARAARRLGLGAVNRLPPLKKLFMRHAMGVVGDLPRLIRGEAL